MRFVLLGLCLGLAGCVRVPSAAPEAAPTPLTVSRPVERDVTDYADFTGRTAAVGVGLGPASARVDAATRPMPRPTRNDVHGYGGASVAGSSVTWAPYR